MKEPVSSLPEPGPALESILSLIPWKSAECQVLRDDERGMRLEWTAGARPFRFELDPLGAEVWRSVDGQRSLAELVETFAGKNRLRFFESAALWIAYTRTLAQRNLILFRQPSSPPP
jgi:hypothetical protein